MNGLLVNVRDHIRRLDERNRERKTHVECDVSPEPFRSNRQRDWLELGAEPVNAGEELEVD
jgi:hypothetical protein